MSEPSDHQEDKQQPEQSPQLRLRTPIVLALVQLAALTYSLFWAPTLLLGAVGFVLVPLVVLIGLGIWWLRSRTIPFKQRLAGVAVIVLSLAWAISTHPGMAVNLLAVVFPIMTFGTVGLLLMTRSQPWPRRRTALLVLLLGTPAIFSAIRIDGARGNLTPYLSWRWEPTPEEFTEASIDPDAKTDGTAAVSGQPGPGDWPGFRGPERNNYATGVTFATNWDDEAPREIWRQRIGIGWSSFTVIGDYFFTQEQRGQDEFTVCYEADTGKQVWVNSVPARFDDANGGGPRATPTYHEGNLYVLGALGALQRLEASTGKTIWKRELTKDADAKVPVWGFSSSPLIVDDLVIVFAGGSGGKSVLAYNKESGELVWHAGDGTHGYTSGQLTEIAGVQQVLFGSDVGIQSFAPDTGEVLWQHEWKAATNPRCVQPILPGSDAVLIGTAGGQGTRRIEVSKTETDWIVEEQWTTRKFRPYFNDAVFHDGFAYGFDGRLFVCIDTTTGERRWKSKRYGGQVLLVPDMDLLLVLSEKGDVILVEATPEAHNVIARFKAIDGKTWNHPVIANGRLYVRNSEEAACFLLPNRQEISLRPNG